MFIDLLCSGRICNEDGDYILSPLHVHRIMDLMTGRHTTIGLSLKLPTSYTAVIRLCFLQATLSSLRHEDYNEGILFW
jgi:hypothetical protein